MRHLVCFLAAAVWPILPALPQDRPDPWVVLEGSAGPGVGKHIVFVTGDEEYRSEEGMPQLAKILALRHGFRCTVLFAINKDTGEIDPQTLDNIPGLEALEDADLLVLFTRFRDLPDEQMRHIVDYVDSGRPIVGLRTATHAFRFNQHKTFAGKWKAGFGREVLGENWVAHHGAHGRQSTRGIPADAAAAKHPILRGIEPGSVWSPADVYRVRLPMDEGIEPLLLGQVLAGMSPGDEPAKPRKDRENRVTDLNDPMMPVAWTRTHEGANGRRGRVFTTTIGTSGAFAQEGTRRLLVNACYWALGLEDQIDARSSVALVGDFEPSPFKFNGHRRGIVPADLRLPATTPTAGSARPNIVFIFTDDHAAHAISAYGSRVNKTPNIDRIAAEGMRFDHCLVTNSLCGPSRACILTGKYSHKNGFFRNGNRFDGSQMTFPKILRRNGYTTAMIGKWHLSSDPTGFDYWEVLRGQGPYYNPNMKTADGPRKHVGYTTEIITDLALEWLENGRDKQKPFMLMYQHKAPHRNWQPGPDYLTMFDGETIPEPPTLWDDYSGRASPAHDQKMTVANDLNANDLKLTPPRNLTPEQLSAWNAAYEPKNKAFRDANLEGRDLVRWKYQRYVKDYLRCVAAVDDNIGRVLDYLDVSGLADNTVVIYSSDQGWYLGDHGWFDKRWMYEESLTMPFVIKWPGVVKPGTTNDAMISNVDFAETFLDIAGLADQIPDDMQGRSFVPLLRGETPSDWRKSFYYHYYEFPGAHSVAKHFGVRTERYKLIDYYRVGEWELFDLLEDPDEMRSVYGDPDYAEITAELEAELARLQKELDETDPQKPVPGDPELRGARKK